jgi:hypothetical protein
MKILEKAILPTGEHIQIEEWNENYSFIPYGSTIGTYPKSKQTLDGAFSPTINKTFRFQLDFNNHEEALKVFDNLKNGKTKLIDYINHFKGKEELLFCI